MRKFLITEEDRKHILGLYGLIKEAIDPNSGGTITINNYYPAGWYTLENKDTKSGKVIEQQLREGLQQVTDFVKKHPDSIVSTKFISQESAIPNKDNEGKHGGSWLELGGLSNLRKNYIEPFIKKYFEDLKVQGVIGQTVEVPPLIYEPKETKTPWVGTPFCPSNSTIEQQRSICVTQYRQGVKNNNSKILEYKKKYDTEQSSALEITVKLKQTTTSVTTTLKPSVTTTTTIPKPDCVAGLKVRVYVPSHHCQNAEFFLFANKTLLYNSAGGYTANLNNSDGSRGVPAFSSQPTMPAWLLNPGYGDLKNGDGTFNYGYGKSKPGGDLSGGRSDTFTITAEQSAQIVKDGKIDFYFICTTDDSHDDIPRVEVLKNGQPLIDEKTKKPAENPINVNNIKGRLFTTDACGTKLIRSTAKLSKSDESSYAGLRAQYVQQLVSEREQIMNNSGIANKIQRIFKKEPDSKGQELAKVQSLINEMLELVKKIIAKDPMYVGKDPLVTNANLQEVYTKLYNIIKSPDGISFERSGGIGSGGPYTYVNKTVNSDKLYGDIRRRLNDFYKAFDAVYYDDDSKKIVPTGIPKRAKILSNMKTDLSDTWGEYLTMGT